MVIDLGNSSKLARDEIRVAAERDVVWFIDTFLWGYNPKDEASAPERPFITYGFQERLAHKLTAAIGVHDLLIPKSRAVGGTYIILARLFHSWLFKRMQSFLLASAKQDRVDRRGDPSTLFWKLDHFLNCLPPWLRPVSDRAELRLFNEETESIFNGESTNQNVDRGGRRTAILADEAAAMNDADKIAASIQHVTNSCIWLSTFQGAYGTFYNLFQRYSAESPDWVVKLHWKDHPVYSKGLYHGPLGPRSPWYDRQCLRAPGPKWIAQELDMEPTAAGGRYFEEELVQRLLAKCIAPRHRGELEHDSEEPKFNSVPSSGRLLLWCDLPSGRPPPGDYVMGQDIALGTGGEMSSQSAVSVYHRTTGLKVAEFKYNRIAPSPFARFCVALAKWFHNAKMIWGCQGPGVTFGKTVTEDCRYFNIFYREDETSTDRKRTRKMGYSEQGDSRIAMFGGYIDALHQGRITNLSKEAVEELRQFIISPTGTIEHSKAMQADDPENKGKLHGDVVISDALACRLLPDKMPKADPERNPTGPPPRGSMAERHWDYLQNKRKVVYF